MCQRGNAAITALSKKCFQLTSCFHSFLGVKVFKDCLHITIYPPWQRPGHSKPHLTDIIASLDSWLPPPNLAPLVAQNQNFSEMSLVRLAKPLMESVYGRSSSFITFHNQLPSFLRLRYQVWCCSEKKNPQKADQERKVMPCDLRYRDRLQRALVHDLKIITLVKSQTTSRNWQ